MSCERACAAPTFFAPFSQFYFELNALLTCSDLKVFIFEFYHEFRLFTGQVGKAAQYQ